MASASVPAKPAKKTANPKAKPEPKPAKGKPKKTGKVFPGSF